MIPVKSVTSFLAVTLLLLVFLLGGCQAAPAAAPTKALTEAPNATQPPVTIESSVPTEADPSVAASPSDVGRWKQIGLAGWEIQSLVVDPSSPSTLYVLGVNTSDPGKLSVVKSTDGGLTWNNASSGLQQGHDLGDLIIDPSSPSTLYLASASNPTTTATGAISFPSGDGVYKTTDGAASWHVANDGLTNKNVANLTLDPVTPSTIYAGTWGGLFKSIDAGAHWTQSSSNPQAMLGEVYIAIDPRNTATLYMGIDTTDGSVLKSTDGGVTWKDTGLISSRVFAMALDPQNPDILYVANGSTVFKTIDGAATWAEVITGNRYNIHSFAFDPSSPGIIYGASMEGVLKSNNGGATWKIISPDLELTPCLAIIPTTPSGMVAGTFRNGVYIFRRK